jgi:hypothetical protein
MSKMFCPIRGQVAILDLKEIILVRQYMDVDECERLSNCTFRNKLKVKEQCFYCCSTFHLDWIALG